MSGGDGIGHNSGPSGGINGGPTGFGGDGRNNSNSNYSDHSGWSSENNGWSSGQWGGSNGPDGSRSGNSGNDGGRGRSRGSAKAKGIGELATLSAATGTLTISIYKPELLTAAELGELTAFLNQTLNKVTPIAGRLLGFFGLFYPSSIAPDPPIDISSMLKEDEQYHVITLPENVIRLPEMVVSGVPAEDISENTSIPVNMLAQPVFDETTKTRQVAITPVNTTAVPVVKAEKTDEPNVYTAQVVPDMKPVRISITQGEQNQAKVNTSPAVGQYLPAPAEKDTHHAIIDFGGEHDSIYISVSKVPTEAEKRAQLEEAEKRKQEWLDAHPLQAAELELSEAQKEFENIDKPYQEKQNYLNQLLNTPAGLTLTDPVNHPYILDRESKIWPVKNIDIRVNTQELLNAALTLDDGESFYDEIERTVIANIHSAAFLQHPSAVQNLVMCYDSIRSTLLNANNQIEAAKKDLAPVMEARDKAENKKKTAQDKVDKESKRNQPGTATGKGEPVGDKWLHDAGKENGAPIPDRIADKLRGKKFKDFNDFRDKFWEEVSKDPELLKQFDAGNQTNIKKGRSPFVPKGEEAGKRRRNEIHHVKPISQDGEVYDMDNLRITTPKRHIEIHRGKK